MDGEMNRAASGSCLYAMIFVLVTIDFLQSGMTAFAALPIMGETGISQEDFSLIAAVYASLAILTISMQRWFVERLGGRRYVQLATAVTAIGSVLCALGNGFSSFLLGRAVMAIGGGALFTSARMIIHHRLTRPKRFTGIKFLAGALSLCTAAAPLIASIAISKETWAAMYWLLALLAAVAFVIAGISLSDDAVSENGQRSTVNLVQQLLLAGGCFALFYALQRFYYDFYSNPTSVAVILGSAIIAIAGYTRLQHRSAHPLLRVAVMLRPRYLAGLAMFLFAYTMLGANNTMIPMSLQRSLSYSWDTVGHVEAIGFSFAFITWVVMTRLLPNYPAPTKYFVVGFLSLAGYGLLLSRLTPTAALGSDILPALVLNSVFLLTVLPVTAMQTFQEMDNDESAFSNAQQLKNMMAQGGIALGIMLATIYQQWRSTVHYAVLNKLVDNDSPVYQTTIHQLQQTLAGSVESALSGSIATAQVAQILSQQAALLGNIDYFMLVSATGLLGAVAILAQRVIRLPR